MVDVARKFSSLVFWRCEEVHLRICISLTALVPSQNLRVDCKEIENKEHRNSLFGKTSKIRLHIFNTKKLELFFNILTNECKMYLICYIPEMVLFYQLVRAVVHFIIVSPYLVHHVWIHRCYRYFRQPGEVQQSKFGTFGLSYTAV